jgi:hypothetical protein
MKILIKSTSHYLDEYIPAIKKFTKQEIELNEDGEIELENFAENRIDKLFEFVKQLKCSENEIVLGFYFHTKHPFIEIYDCYRE